MSKEQGVTKAVIFVTVICVLLFLTLIFLPRHVRTESFKPVFLNGYSLDNRNIYYFNLSDDEELLPPFEAKIKVVNARNATPIERANVTIYGHGLTFSNFTDENGFTSILLEGYSIPKGTDSITLTIEITKDGYRKLRWEDYVELHR